MDLACQAWSSGNESDPEVWGPKISSIPLTLETWSGSNGVVSLGTWTKNSLPICQMVSCKVSCEAVILTLNLQRKIFYHIS